MLIDTGNPFSIITKELAEILEVKVRETKVDLSSPDGGDIIVYGKADVDLDILGQKTCQEFLKAKDYVRYNALFAPKIKVNNEL